MRPGSWRTRQTRRAARSTWRRRPDRDRVATIAVGAVGALTAGLLLIGLASIALPGIG